MSKNKVFIAMSGGVDSSVSVMDGATKQWRKLVKCNAKPHVAMGEPSGTEQLFIFLGNRAPYRGPAFGLDSDVFCHDIYLASAYPIEARDDRLVEPAVVRTFREVLGRDPGAEEAFRWTAQVRAGTSGQQLRDALAASDETQSCLKRVYLGLFAKAPDARELARWQAFLRQGGTYAQFVARLAD